MADSTEKKSRIPIDFSSTFTLTQLQSFVESFNDVQSSIDDKSPANVIKAMAKGSEEKARMFMACWKALKAAKVASDEKVPSLTEFNDEVKLLEPELVVKAAEARAEANEKIATYREKKMNRAAASRSLFWGRLGKFLTIAVPVVLGIGLLAAAGPILGAVAGAIGGAASIGATVATAVGIYAAGWGIWKAGTAIHKRFAEKFDAKILNAQKALDTLKPETEKLAQEFAAMNTRARSIENNRDNSKKMVNEMAVTDAERKQLAIRFAEKLDAKKLKVKGYGDAEIVSIMDNEKLKSAAERVQKADTIGQMRKIEADFNKQFDSYLTENWQTLFASPAIESDLKKSAIGEIALFSTFKKAGYGKQEQDYINQKYAELVAAINTEKAKPEDEKSLTKLNNLVSTFVENFSATPKKSEIENAIADIKNSFKEKFATNETFAAASAELSSARSAIKTSADIENYKNELAAKLKQQTTKFMTKEQIKNAEISFYSAVLSKFKNVAKEKADLANKNPFEVVAETLIAKNPNPVSAAINMLKTEKKGVLSNEDFKKKLETDANPENIDFSESKKLSANQRKMLTYLTAEFDRTAYDSKKSVEMEGYILSTVLNLNSKTKNEFENIEKNAIKYIRENVKKEFRSDIPDEAGLPLVHTPAEEAIRKFMEKSSTSQYEKAVISTIFESNRKVDREKRGRIAAQIKNQAEFENDGISTTKNQFTQAIKTAINSPDAKSLELDKNIVQTVAKDTFASALSSYPSAVVEEALKRMSKQKAFSTYLNQAEVESDLDKVKKLAEKLDKSPESYFSARNKTKAQIEVEKDIRKQVVNTDKEIESLKQNKLKANLELEKAKAEKEEFNRNYIIAKAAEEESKRKIEIAKAAKKAISSSGNKNKLTEKDSTATNKGTREDKKKKSIKLRETAKQNLVDAKAELIEKSKTKFQASNQFDNAVKNVQEKEKVKNDLKIEIKKLEEKSLETKKRLEAAKDAVRKKEQEAEEIEKDALSSRNVLGRTVFKVKKAIAETKDVKETKKEESGER